MNSLAPYLSPSERENRLDALATRLGGEIKTIGESVEGRPLRVVRVPRCPAINDVTDSDSGRSYRRILLSANIHGVELIGTMVALGFLSRLSEGDDETVRLRAKAEIWVLPSINPDGYARTWERGGVGRIGELRPNARGVDLNRNFPLPGPQPWWAAALGGLATGSSVPGTALYRGPTALSEPETAAVAKLCRINRFVASANLHSFMGAVLPAHVDDRADFARYRHLAAAFRRSQRQVSYRCLSSRRLDCFTGEMEDFLHHHCGTWSVCIEVYPLAASFRQHLRAPCLFWRFNPRDPDPWIENDIPGLLAYFLTALEMAPPGVASRPV